MSSAEEPEQTPIPPIFDPESPHHQKPKLRPVRGFSARNGEQVMLGLSDAHQISDQVVFTAPQAQVILQQLTGELGLDAIVANVGRGLRREDVEMLVAQLDQAGLLEGPTFEAMWAKVQADFDSLAHLPPASTANFADALVMQSVEGEEVSDEQKREQGPRMMAEMFDKWIDEALKNVEKPSLDSLPTAVIAPHLDYARGWLNYALVYGRMRVVDRPDRILILGTNHFGRSPGVCACDKGFETPFGLCEVDTELVRLLEGELGVEQGERFFQHKYDHEREHSIELHVPWIQHVFGADDNGQFPRVLGVLVHDPAVNNGASYDGDGVDLSVFVDAAKAAIANAPGRTLIVSSADLSHVGTSFGDKQSIVGDTDEAKAFRQKIFDHDKEMLELVKDAKAEELVASIAWQQNPTRWCSVGNIVATMKISDAESVEIMNYTMAADQQGIACVSSCAAVIA